MITNNIKVPTNLRLRTVLMKSLEPFYRWLGSLESWVLKEEIASQKIKKPIYVSSLPRSGTTIISEILSQHSDVCYHSYMDFPNIFTPYWKHWLKKRAIINEVGKQERSHQDRIKVNQNSIEAFEEVLWQNFFENIHKDGMAHRVKYDESSPFNEYYQQHIKKLLLVKKKTRYLAKANYNINRLNYLLNLFPDARFVIPVRHPVNHIASLSKQHKMFLEAGKNNPQIDRQLAASGHYEFGRLREVVVFDDIQESQRVLDTFVDDLHGWATYWNYFYQSVLRLKQQSKAINQAIIMVKYEDLCLQPDKVIDAIFTHCQLSGDGSDTLKSTYKTKLSLPTYYDLPFNNDEVSAMMKTAKTTANYFGYDNNNYHQGEK